MSNKDIYKQYNMIDKNIPLFSRDWWMECVCGADNWDVLIIEKGGRVLASLPFYIKKIFGFRYITQPKLTQTNGIWINYPDNQRYPQKLAFEKRIIEEVVSLLALKKIIYYNQNYNCNFTNWLPFYWKSFKQELRYTYILKDLSDLNKIYLNFEPNVRTQIKKAEKHVVVKEDCNIETFFKINLLTFERQKRKAPYSFDFLKKLDEACKLHDCRKIFYAEDEKKNIHAVLYLVWDENSAYYLMGGGDPAYRNSDAGTLLIWEAIKYASKVTKQFNFEGSMIETIESFFRDFGANLNPYFNISKGYKGYFIYKVVEKLYLSCISLKSVIFKYRGKK